MKFYFLLLILFIFENKIYCQKENSVWYFGRYYGLDFRMPEPTIIQNSEMFSPEATSSISDSTGHILLYSNGESVWNKNHLFVPNGSDLNGHKSSAQGALLVRKPESKNLYYLFTSDQRYINKSIPQNGIKYSVIDISKNNGDGLVISKDNNLCDWSNEQLCAIEHYNKVDIWIVIKQNFTDSIFVFLLTKDGISNNVKKFGTEYHQNDNISHMKFSPDGKYICIPNGNGSGLNNNSILYKFNNQTGDVKFKTKIKITSQTCEFSPNSNYLYIGILKIFQINILELKDTFIPDSNSNFIKVNYSGPYCMQTAINGKIYLSTSVNSDSILDVINFPNSRFDKIGYEAKKIIFYNNRFYNKLGEQTLGVGLPNIVIGNIRPFIASANYCLNNRDTTLFSIYNGYNDSVFWNFGDGYSNFSTGFCVKHRYNYSGQFQVTAIYKNINKYDTIYEIIKIYNEPKLNLGNDTILCNQSNLTLSLNNPSWTSILWQDSSKNNSITVSDTGTYFVSVQNEYCKDADTIKIFKFNCDLTINGTCLGDSTSLNFNDTNAYQKIVKWGDSSRDTSEETYFKHKYVLPNNYSGTVRIAFKQASIELPFNANIIKVEKPQLGNDTIICSDKSFDLSLSNNIYDSIKWNTGITQSNLQISKSGLYWVRVKNKNCFNADTIKIINLNCDLSIKGFCLNDSTTFQLNTNEVDSFKFNFGDGRLNLFKKSEYLSNLYLDIKSYHINYVYYKDGLFLNLDSSFDIKDCECAVYVPDAFSPDKTLINDEFFPVTSCYLSEISLEIYDRWGGVIYKTTSFRPKWNGCNSNGDVLQNGVYVWMIKYINPTTNKLQLKTGSVTLMR